MKLLFAGISNSTSLDSSKFMFNCTRNARCQKEYFIPIHDLQEIYFFADLPGKPLFIETYMVDICCQNNGGGGSFNNDFNNDFDIGNDSDCVIDNPIIFDKYVVGTTPANKYYGVFQTTATNPTFRRFYFRFVFTIGAEKYIYYSEQYEIEPCDPLLCLRGCYPNEPIGSSSWDCNGIYYGFPNNPSSDILGQANLRYFHQACVRKGSIIETTAKLTLSLFNSKRTYKSVLQREQTLEFELVPSFYKNTLLGIFARGQVQAQGKEYTLTEEQNWKVLDFDSKLWQLDTLLKEECNNYFGCAPADCVLPLLPCLNEITQDDWFVTGSVFTQVFAGSIGSGSIEWEIQDENHILQYSGTILTTPLQFAINDPAINPHDSCFYIRWRINCGNGQYSPWLQNQFGNCSGGGGTTVCKKFVFQVFGPDDSQYRLTAVLCDGTNYDSGPRYVGDGAHPPICAVVGTVNIVNIGVGGMVIESEDGDCETIVCEEYYNNLNHDLEVNYTDCSGVYHGNAVVSAGDSICIQPGTGSGSGFGFLILLGNC